MRIEGVILEYQPHTPIFGGKLGNVALAKEDLPAGRLLQAADHIQRGALAASGGAQQTDELPIGNGEAHIVYRYHFLIGFLVPAGENLGYVPQFNFHTIFPYALFL